jgi:hypothetical protein
MRPLKQALEKGSKKGEGLRNCIILPLHRKH